MSRLRDIDDRLQTLTDINGIVRAMRNLALMETQKLARYAATQRQSIEFIEAAAADFLHWHPGLLVPPTRRRPLYLLFGSERGFCGEFNDAVLTAFRQRPGASTESDPLLLLVGSRLARHAATLPGTIVTIPGPSVSEEIPTVIERLVEHLRTVQGADDHLGILGASVGHHVWTHRHSEVVLRQAFWGLRHRAVRGAYPPDLTLSPHQFAMELVDHYLFAMLHDLLHHSLLSENQHRVRHMEQALKRMEDRRGDLTLTRNTLRQEEITQEIETIMLSAEFLRRAPS